jgi:uncharacterized protein YggE
MIPFRQLLVVLLLAAAGAPAHAQSQSQSQSPSVATANTLVIVPAAGEVTHQNDEATATFSVEEQDKDKAAAASRVNSRMRAGMEVLRRADPQARLKTHGYYTYPVYPDDRPPPPGTLAKPRVPTAWRVGQSVELRTTNVAALEKTVAAAQRVLALNGLQFGLAPDTLRTLDDQRIAATYRNLNERIAAIARAMGRRLEDAVLDTVDFEASGNYGDGAQLQMAGARAKMAMEPAEVSEPSFEPGETTLQMRVVGKVRFK